MVKDHKALRPTDWIVYGVVYWYEHLKEGRCIASNPSIARVAGVEERTVRAALDRLEEAGFIKRIYKDSMKKQRSEVKALVRYGVPAQSPQAVIPGMELPKDETPGEFAGRFFSNDDEAIRRIIEDIMTYTHGHVNQDMLIREMKKFTMYWTEPNKSGTKVKWQLQQTFDVKRRLYTWLGRAGVKAGSSNRAGAGATV